MPPFFSMAVGEIVQRIQGNIIAAIISGVDGEDMDAATSIVQPVASTAHGRVPFNALDAANSIVQSQVPRLFLHTTSGSGAGGQKNGRQQLGGLHVKDPSN
ncbi:hypothetical protein TgHK011_003334 [Trichoderma gracile]|nr:hypothetical protein TgHK011_003334 [Trichoderma gracile]